MNQEKNKIDLFRFIATIIAGIIASLPIVLGIIQLTYGTIFTLHFTITYFVLPLGFFAVEFFLLKSSKRKTFKVITGVIAVIVFVYSILFIFSIYPYERMVSYKGEEALIEYDLIPATVALPSSSELGQYEKIEFIQFEYDQSNSTSNSDYLICQYNAENYQQQKDLLQQRYLLQESTDENSYYSASSVGDYDFRMLPENAHELCFPKYLSFIVTNDKTHEIIYMYTTNMDIEYAPVEELLLEDCGWEHIR